MVGLADYIVLGMDKKWGEPGYVDIALRVDRINRA
jgi:hypothetical protein